MATETHFLLPFVWVSIVVQEILIVRWQLKFSSRQQLNLEKEACNTFLESSCQALHVVIEND
jgi:hypothetical protein